MSMTTTAAVNPPAQFNTLTFIDFLLDETGSMSICESQTRAGFDNFVAGQREVEGQCFLTLAKFDSGSVKIPYENLDLGMVPELSFYPGGGTNLYDCIGDRLSAVMDQNRGGKSLFVIMTDGADNASQRYNISSARELVLRAQELGVVVVFLGPDHDALKVGTSLGIPEGNIKPFDTANMKSTMSSLNNATTAFRAGTSASTEFFN